MTPRILAALALILTLASPRAPGAPVSNGTTVATINDLSVPYEWFDQEFRSSYFRYGPIQDVRQAVFDDFLRKMILYTAASTSGVTNDPAVMTRIEKQVDGMRRHYEYQIAMARVTMTIDAYLEKLGTIPPIDSAGDEVTRAYYEQEMAGRNGAPATFDEVPEEFRAQVRRRAGLALQRELLRDLSEELRAGMEITVDQDLVDSIPLPDATGDVPPEYRNAEPAPAADARAVDTPGR